MCHYNRALRTDNRDLRHETSLCTDIRGGHRGRKHDRESPNIRAQRYTRSSAPLDMSPASVDRHKAFVNTLRSPTGTNIASLRTTRSNAGFPKRAPRLRVPASPAFGTKKSACTTISTARQWPWSRAWSSTGDLPGDHCCAQDGCAMRAVNAVTYLSLRCYFVRSLLVANITPASTTIPVRMPDKRMSAGTGSADQ